MSPFIKRISRNGIQPRISGIANKIKVNAESKSSQNYHRSFKEMIEWRRERQKKERLVRNKVRRTGPIVLNSLFSISLEIDGYT